MANSVIKSNVITEGLRKSFQRTDCKMQNVAAMAMVSRPMVTSLSIRLSQKLSVGFSKG